MCVLELRQHSTLSITSSHNSSIHEGNLLCIWIVRVDFYFNQLIQLKIILNMISSFYYELGIISDFLSVSMPESVKLSGWIFS